MPRFSPLRHRRICCLAPLGFALGLFLISIAPVTAAGWRPKSQPVVRASATAPVEAAPALPAAPGPDDIPPAQVAAKGDRAADAAAETSPPAELIAPATAGAPPRTARPQVTEKSVAADGPSAAATPACIRCGSSCDLIPFCRCEPATRKKPRTIYGSKCELVCEPGIGLFGHHHSKRLDGCTDCSPACGPSRICQKKTLIKTVKEDDVCHIKREVGYLCRCCAGECSGCDAAGCKTKPTRRRPPLLDWKPFGWLETFWK